LCTCVVEVMVEGELVWSVTMRVPSISHLALVGHASDFCPSTTLKSGGEARKSNDYVDI
jgi:hypothetical protein